MEKGRDAGRQRDCRPDWWTQILGAMGWRIGGRLFAFVKGCGALGAAPPFLVCDSKALIGEAC